MKLSSSPQKICPTPIAYLFDFLFQSSFTWGFWTLSTIQSSLHVRLHPFLFSLINSTQAHPSIHENDRSQFFLPTDWCEEGNCFFKLVIELFFVHSVRRRTVETEKLEIFFCVTLSLQSRYLYVCNIFTAQDSDYSTLMSCKRVSFFELHGLKKSSLVFPVNSGITKKQAT